jgi:hypothetical protein
MRARLLGWFWGFFGSRSRFELGFAGRRDFYIAATGFGREAGSLFRIKICRLQGRRRGLTSRLRSFLLASL